MHRSLVSSQKPSRASISAMLHRYQEERKPRMQKAFDASVLMTRLQACDGNLNHVIMRYIFPVMGQASYADKLADLCSGAPKLDFLPVRYNKPATFRWKDGSRDPKPPTEVQTHRKGNKMQRIVFMELASLMSIVLFIFSFLGRGNFDSPATKSSLALNESTYGFILR